MQESSSNEEENILFRNPGQQRIFERLGLIGLALALLLTGMLRIVLLGLYPRIRIKKPTTGTATTLVHDHLPGTIKSLSIAQSKVSVKNQALCFEYQVGQIREHTRRRVTNLSIPVGQFSGR